MSHNLWIPIKDRMKGKLLVITNYHKRDLFKDGIDILQDKTGNLLNIEKEGELNVIITISGTMEEVIGLNQEEEEVKIKDRFVRIYTKPLYTSKEQKFEFFFSGTFQHFL